MLPRNVVPLRPERADPTRHAIRESLRSAGCFLLASAQRTLWTQGVRSVVDFRAADVTANRALTTVREALRTPPGRREERLVVGVIPFDQNAAARLVVPEHVSWSGPLADRPLETATLQQVLSSLAVPEPTTYMGSVRTAVERIREGRLRKVVLARALELQFASAVEVDSLVLRLSRRNPGAYTFAFDISEVNDHPREAENNPPSRLLVGASPELLVSRHGMTVNTNPLAGSVARGTDSVTDWRHASALLRSRKDRAEHAFVVEDVAERLRPFCTRLDIPPEPSLVQTSTLWHLSTRIRGTLRDPEVCSLTLATALHPTPAVCGTPRDAAITTIRDLEGFDRGFYAGLVGWCNAAGDGEWVLCIRCAEVEGSNVRLCAGAGIVEQSQPADELAETTVKLTTLLSALGVDSLP
jgi:isochorismate synthase